MLPHGDIAMFINVEGQLKHGSRVNLEPKEQRQACFRISSHEFLKSCINLDQVEQQSNAYFLD